VEEIGITATAMSAFVVRASFQKQVSHCQMKHTFSGSSALIACVACVALPLTAAAETKLRDETGKTIVKYVIQTT